MALVRLRALDAATSAHAEALLRAALGLHLRHDASALSICCPRRCSPAERLCALLVSAPDRLRACSGDAVSLPLSSEPAASPFAGLPTAETVRRRSTARGRRGCAPANGCRIPGAPSRGRGNAA